MSKDKRGKECNILPFFFAQIFQRKLFSFLTDEEHSSLTLWSTGFALNDFI